MTDKLETTIVDGIEIRLTEDDNQLKRKRVDNDKIEIQNTQRLITNRKTELCNEHNIYYKICFKCYPNIECIHYDNMNKKYKINTFCNECINIVNLTINKYNNLVEKELDNVKLPIPIKPKKRSKWELCNKHNIAYIRCIRCQPDNKCPHNKTISISKCNICITEYNKKTNDNYPLIMREQRDISKIQSDDILDKYDNNIYEILLTLLRCEHIDNKFMCYICTPECRCIHSNSVFKCYECKQHNKIKSAIEFLKKNNYTKEQIEKINNMY